MEMVNSEPFGADQIRPIVIVSNRGPLSFSVADAGSADEGGTHLVAKRGAGGLVSGIGPLVNGADVMWIAAAMTDGDRLAADHGAIDAEGFRVRLLALDPKQYQMYYNVICNATLWFVHHQLFDLSRRPRFDTHWRAAWDAYRAINMEFAQVVIEEAPPDSVILVQDYHLALMAPFIKAGRRDLTTVHFSHTPFAGPDQLRVLPDDVSSVLLEAMAGFDACGFHTRRWASAFEQSCAEIISETPRTFVSPLAPDLDDISEIGSSGEAARELAWIESQIGDRLLIARVDRIELSKNLLRGFQAFEDLLDRYDEMRGRVVFGAFVYPSREGLAEYSAYRQEVETIVARINSTWETPEWTPILLDTSDNFPRSIAALQRYDVLLVNPIRDGLNLVAKEGASVNTRSGVLVLSTEAGAWSELGEVALRINPFDVSGTADVLHRALSMSIEQRSAHAAALRQLAVARTPRDWFNEQLAAAHRGA